MNIKKIGVAGSGTMGSGIAQILASRGYEVVLYDLGQDYLDRGRGIISTYQGHLIDNDLLTKEEASKTFKHIDFSLDKNDFADCDLIIEAIVEVLDIKIDFWRQIEKVVRTDAILASNTSGLSINAMSTHVKDKTRFIGTHFWNPPHIIPLVELIRADETSEEVLATMKELVESVGKESVVVNKDVPGFIGNRLQFAVFREALKILEEGVASAEDIDRAMKFGPGFRYPALGPLETADLGGLDIFYNISSYLFEDLSDSKEVPSILKEKVEKGELGLKSKKGFYDYSDGRDQKVLSSRDRRFFKQLKIR